MASSDDRADYSDILAAVWGATDPEQPIHEKLARAEDDTIIGALIQIRDGRLLLAVAKDDMPEPHSEELEHQMKDTIKKLDKNIARIVSDYARTLDNLQGCTCGDCRRSAAPMN